MDTAYVVLIWALIVLAGALAASIVLPIVLELIVLVISVLGFAIMLLTLPFAWAFRKLFARDA